MENQKINDLMKDGVEVCGILDKPVMLFNNEHKAKKYATDHDCLVKPLHEILFGPEKKKIRIRR